MFCFLTKNLVYLLQDFPDWGMGEGVPTTSRKFDHSSPPGKTPLHNVYSPLSCHQQFSCYSPMKTSISAVVIAPVPFLFSLYTLHTQVMLILILIDVQ